ncbi:MAG: hypothetical protein ACXWAA_15105 [Methylobacter sp.]
MLVKYKGWGWFEYEIDFDYMKDETAQTFGSKSWSEEEQKVETCVFELPKFAQIEMQCPPLKETHVNYLLLSKHSYLPVNLSFPCKDEIRFILCDDDPKFDEGCYQLQREQKMVIYTIDDLVQAPCINNASRNETESSSYIDGIVDMPEIETDLTQNGISKRKRGPTKITIFLTELCQKQDINRLSARSLIFAIRPLVSTVNCPVEKFHGFYNEVCVEWKPGTGSPQGSWGKKSFQNFVTRYKKAIKNPSIE